MAFSQRNLLSLLILLSIFSPISSSRSIIRTVPEKHSLSSSGGISGTQKSLDLYCESWRFTVETNNTGPWSRIPEKCIDFVKEYITGDLYAAESEAVADNAVAHATAVKNSGDGKNAWVFDIDETLLSNVPYYADRGFGSEIFDEASFNEWVDLAVAPAGADPGIPTRGGPVRPQGPETGPRPLPPGVRPCAPALAASLRLYNVLEDLGFTIFLLTGRDEDQRNATVKNLKYAGYSNYERLFLRGPDDQGTPATVYKSKKRKEIEDEGYIIQGNSGDQWSDLTGYAVAKRSFKLPNPLYYIA